MADHTPTTPLASHGLLPAIKAEQLDWDKIKDKPLKTLIQLTGHPRHFADGNPSFDSSFEAVAHAMGDKPLQELGIEDLAAATAGMLHNINTADSNHNSLQQDAAKVRHNEEYLQILTLAWKKQVKTVAETVMKSGVKPITDHTIFTTLTEAVNKTVHQKGNPPSSTLSPSTADGLKALSALVDILTLSTNDQTEQENKLQSWMQQHLSAAVVSTRNISSPSTTSYEIQAYLSEKEQTTMIEAFKGNGLTTYGQQGRTTIVYTTKDSPLDVVLGQRAAEQTRSR